MTADPSKIPQHPPQAPLPGIVAAGACCSAIVVSEYYVGIGVELVGKHFEFVGKIVDDRIEDRQQRAIAARRRPVAALPRKTLEIAGGDRLEVNCKKPVFSHDEAERRRSDDAALVLVDHWRRQIQAVADSVEAARIFYFGEPLIGRRFDAERASQKSDLGCVGAKGV